MGDVIELASRRPIKREPLIKRLPLETLRRIRDALFEQVKAGDGTACIELLRVQSEILDRHLAAFEELKK